MLDETKTDLELTNIPPINILLEFFTWNRVIRSEKFRNQFGIGHKAPIRTPLMIWGGDPSDFLTMILQRTILGLESYMWVAVWMKLGTSVGLTPEMNAKVKNPFSIRLMGKQRGAAHRYYNVLPALIDPEYALEKKNNPLWIEMNEFYKTVRNKILHGYQIGSTNPEVLYKRFDMFEQTYEWVNAWHPMVVKEGKSLSFVFGKWGRPHGKQ